MSRVHRFLRSGRTAGWLLVLLGVWMGLATAVPQGALTEPEVATWRSSYPVLASLATLSGLHRAYVAPVFVVLSALLAASTAVCSWARTRSAIRAYRAVGVVDQARLDRLERRPDLVLRSGEDTSTSLKEAAETLRGLGLRVRSGPRMAEGVSGVWARFASPVFHWSLVGLFVTIPLGQLTGASGLIGVPVGGSVVDEPEAYGLLSQGPWNRGLSGLAVGVEEMPLAFVSGGVDRGASPLVTLSRPDGTEVARGQVYPNSALRHGALAVHMSDYGLLARISVLQQGEVAASTELLLDFEDELPGGTTVASVGLVDDTGADTAIVHVWMELDPDGSGGYYHELPDSPAILVEVEDPRNGTVSSASLAVGESVETPGGRLVLDELGYYARLSLVEDWSIPLVYAFFTIASLAVAVSLLMPYRVVHVLDMCDSEDDRRLHVVVRHGRSDHGFKERVVASLGGSFDTEKPTADDEDTRASGARAHPRKDGGETG